ncbi:DUF6716 putative glycosyltransferase [Leifsonia poae]|uniref:DUF6716 putative glycosyltransferase n=1 Tax=Leifsonia poae TaxID=110933 RepID=UPI003D67ABA8
MGAHLLSASPAEWELDVVTVATPVSASRAQLSSAFRGVDVRLAPLVDAPPTVSSVDDVVERIRLDPPDAVLVATLGPVAELLIDEIHRRVSPRPVLITGLPGISYPAKWKGLFLRARADLFVLHSRREVREYTALAEDGGVVPHYGLATLPFVGGERDRAQTDALRAHTAPVRDSVVFAAQPSVPSSREDRERIVGWLAATAVAHPEWRIVIKTRAVRGEKQTHHETYPYAELLPPDAPPNLVVLTGPMSAHLDRALALVTVSSTAVIEAIGRGLPCLVFTDFGVSRSMINEVFVGSGLEGSAADLIAGRFRTVDAGWLDDNYFHPASSNDWAARAAGLMDLRDHDELPRRAAVRRNRGGALRRAWERKIALGANDRSGLGAIALAIGTPIRGTKRLVRRLTRSLRRAEPSTPQG